MKVKFFTQIFEIKREDDYPISLEVFFLIKLNSNILWIKWGGGIMYKKKIEQNFKVKIEDGREPPWKPGKHN